MKEPPGLLGDTRDRAYGGKLGIYSRFLEPELREIVAGLGLEEGDRVLDAGCGVGLTTIWLAAQVAPAGSAVGIDLSDQHIHEARRESKRHDLPLRFMQADLTEVSFDAGSFDLIWSCNTIHHLRDRIGGIRNLAASLRPGGRIAVAQSFLVPELIFAWDQRLQHEVISATRRYYREKYGLDERDTADIPNTYGWLVAAGLRDVRAETVVVERTPPLSDADRAYFQKGVFEGYWGRHVQPYLDGDDWDELQRLTDPQSPGYALDRPDFHHIQTLTVVSGYA